ncbi:restriction endonuclease subunit S, partial [Apilactobacillus xinyiensis]|uniref:restriction endonuclease subunit S n=1 Tax=Apilactobacillus xinyiensis TaxID=2841032 RepID=UPI0031FE6038
MSNKKVPRLRFKEFSGEWEEKKLGDIANVVGGGTPSTNNFSYWNGNINWYSPIEIGEKIWVSDSIKKITALGLKKSSAKLLPKGTILFTSRAGIGKTAILSTEATTNQGFQSIVPNSKMLDTYFLFSMSNILKKYGEKMGSGSTFSEVSGNQMKKMHMLIPILKEQEKIG